MIYYLKIVNEIMELRVLEYFLAVAREQSFSEAADFLHLTQPPLDKLINTEGTDLCFRPLPPKQTVGMVLVRKKYQPQSKAAEKFIETLTTKAAPIGRLLFCAIMQKLR